MPAPRLDGKSAIITGSSRGIGLLLARSFLEQGCSVLLAATDAATLEKARVELSSVGPPVEAVRCDVTIPAEVDRMMERAAERFGKTDILINNAGVLGPVGPLWETDPGEWNRAVEVNLTGTCLCCRAVLPSMIRRRQGKIINLSGKGAAAPWPRFSAYAASKAAVVRFTETLAEEVRPHNIQVNVMAPGANDTDMLRAAARSEPDLLRGLPADPLKPGRLALFLASEMSDHITGRFIHVNQNWDEWTEADVAGDRYTLRRV